MPTTAISSLSRGESNKMMRKCMSVAMASVWILLLIIMPIDAAAKSRRGPAFLPRGTKNTGTLRSRIPSSYSSLDFILTRICPASLLSSTSTMMALRGGESEKKNISGEKDEDGGGDADADADTLETTQETNQISASMNNANADDKDEAQEGETKKNYHHTPTRTLAETQDNNSNDKQEIESSSSGDNESVDVPSLDTFINYDESTDALSSMAPILETTNTLSKRSAMAPILETTTTHVLDAMVDKTATGGSVTDKVGKQQQQYDVDGKASVEDGTNETSGEEAAMEGEEEEASERVDDTILEIETTLEEDLTFEAAQEESSLKRLEGKQLHDDGDFQAAALAFSQAANVLEEFVDESIECSEDWSTCRLHEALCCLKADDSATAVDACTRVLDRPSTSGAVRARALYRRAKAYMGLEQSDLALQDARSAAFLGDRRGVALYGQLMRESPGLSSSSSLSSGSGMMDDFASSSALFESLLSKSSGSQSGEFPKTESPSPPFNPLSLLSGMDNGEFPMGGKGMDTGGLAKSVITSLSKRLEDEDTQDTICKYLQKTSGPQIQQYAGMAGMELPESQATRIANFLRRVTPNSIRKTVKNGKRLLYGVQLIRKTSKVINKYRNLLIWICLLAWAKSAVTRPIPINKRIARLEAKQATKKA